MIEADHLTKRYGGGRTALDRLCLQVHEGEVFGFLGPNGAGKTTTIRILTTLSLPTEGSARVAGFDVVRDPQEVRRNIGYVAQESGVEFWLTGRENLMLQGHLYHLDRKLLISRVSDVLKIMDLEEAADQMVYRYSGGMRRKLDIATALLHQPRLLFLDEPTLGLDPQSRLNLWEYIRRINQNQGMTIFLTTHYLEEADKLAHRLGILDHGNLKVLDTPDHLKDSIGGDVVILSLEDAPEAAKASEVQQQIRALSFVKDLLVVDREWSIYVKQGREALPKLLQTIDAAGVVVQAVTLSRPSLDDVFLKYSGRRLKEEKESGSGGDWQKWWKPQSGGEDSQDWQKWQKTQEGQSQGKSQPESGDGQGQQPWWDPQSGEGRGASQDWQKWQSGRATDENSGSKEPSGERPWKNHASSG